MRIAWRAGLVALVIAFLGGAIITQSGRIGDVHWRFSPGWLALCLLSLVAFQWCHIEIWRLILRALGGELEPRKARAIWSTALLARYVPTSMLMVVGRVALCEREGVPKRVTLASVVYEFALTVISALTLSAYLVLSLHWFDSHTLLRYIALAVPLVGLACLHPAIFHRAADHALARLGRDALPLSLTAAQGLRFAVMYLGSFVVGGLSVLAMAHALHPLGAGDTPFLIAAFALGYVTAVLGFVIPASLGAREVGIALGLSTVLPGAAAVAVAIAVRLLQTAVELTYAAVTPVLARRGHRAARELDKVSHAPGH